MNRLRKLNGIFWDDKSVFTDPYVMQHFKSDQADWTVKDWIRFHKELIAYYIKIGKKKEYAEKKSTDIVYEDYMNLNFYSKPSLDCEGANYFAKYGIEKDFFTKIICAGVDIVDSTGTIIENVGKTATKTASITTTLQNNIIHLAVLGGLAFWIYKKNGKNGTKKKR